MSIRSKPSLCNDDYTIGWVCALEYELAAAQAMLEEEHSVLPRAERDSNTYALGRIGPHNIVIAGLPAGTDGTSAVATVTANLLRSFPKVRFGLMVGIGGGAPCSPSNDPEEDIHLGDVVLSYPHGEYGGVIQYDFGRTISEGKFIHTGSLNKPPTPVMTALAKMRARHYIDGNRIRSLILEVLRAKHRMKRKFQFPGFDNDRLYEITYVHSDDLPDCANCDKECLVSRKVREFDDPVVHYGLIGSANQVMNDGFTRERLRKQRGILCFEMEAGGLMDDFPCIVIRGVSDYSDTHKNRQWQPYAAMTAAACATELLSYIPSEDVQQSPRAAEFMKDIDEIKDSECQKPWAGLVLTIIKVAKNINVLVDQTSATIREEHLAGHDRRVLNWLAAPDPSSNFNSARTKCHPGTGFWLLEHPSFLEWKSGTQKCLWLHGIPGCGKTILCSTIIDHLRRTSAHNAFPVLNYFFDFNDQGKQTAESFLRSIISQLYIASRQCRQEADKLFSKCGDGSSTPTTDSLSHTFQRMMQYFTKVYLIIDALDECNTRQDMISWLRSAANSRPNKLSIIATSRLEIDLESGIKTFLSEGSFISLQQHRVDPDIYMVVEEKLLVRDGGFERWHKYPQVLDEIKTGITRKAAGMFRWAACQLDVLRDCISLPQLRNALENLPMTLDETYSRILANIPRRHEQYTVRILQFLVYSKRPLFLEEIVDALAVELDKKPSFDASWRMPKPEEIAKICPSLLLVAPASKWRKSGLAIRLAHFSVKEYLLSDRVDVTFKQSLTEISAQKAIILTCLAYITHVAEVRQVQRPSSREAALINGEAEPDGFVVLEGSIHDPLGYGHSKEPCSTPRDEGFPFLKYSSLYWMKHADDLTSVEEVDCAIYRFSRDRLVFPFFASCIENYLGTSGFNNPMFYASYTGCLNVVRMLLEYDGNGNERSNEIGSSLQVAAYRGHQEVVQLLLEYNSNVNVEGGEYGNALQAASYWGNETIVRVLLNNGADPDARSSCFGNALQAAAYGMNKAIVQLLLPRVTDFHTPEEYYGNKLQAAAGSGDEEMVGMLLDRGADARTQCGGCFGNAIIAASANGHSNVVRVLLEHGADIEASGGEYGSALQAAVLNGRQNTVRMLLGHGADIHVLKASCDCAVRASGHNSDIVEMVEGARGRIDDPSPSGEYSREGDWLQISPAKNSSHESSVAEKCRTSMFVRERRRSV